MLSVSPLLTRGLVHLARTNVRMGTAPQTPASLRPKRSIPDSILNVGRAAGLRPADDSCVVTQINQIVISKYLKRRPQIGLFGALDVVLASMWYGIVDPKYSNNGGSRRIVVRTTYETEHYF